MNKSSTFAAKAFSTSDNLGRNDKEIDFVLRENNRVKQLVQVSYEMTSEKTIRRECSALKEAAQELHCNDLYVLTYNEKRTLDLEGCTIRVLPATEWFK